MPPILCEELIARVEIQPSRADEKVGSERGIPRFNLFVTSQVVQEVAAVVMTKGLTNERPARLIQALQCNKRRGHGRL